ncbi:hypothetical protein [Psychrobacter lutiphocae]|uniref:hypothetical protein n=1 Tax=Psychrobacter lutiphocae TaxID=540500 RepID=UPI00036863E4|nr:hypothetical protein [Psychrobacter lutiphocae]
MKQNKKIDLTKLINCFNDYSFKSKEDIEYLYIDFSFNLNCIKYYTNVIISLYKEFTCLEEFVAATLYNSLEDVYRDCEYESYITEIKPQFISEKDLINTLKELGISLKFDVNYSVMLFEIGFERFIVGELINGNYFSIAVLNINSSYSPKNINN